MKSTTLLFLLLFSLVYSPIQASHSFVVDFIDSPEKRNTEKITKTKKWKSKILRQQVKRPKTDSPKIKRHPLAVIGFISSVYFVGWAIKFFFFPFIGYVSSIPFWVALGSWLSLLSGPFGVVAGLVAISRIKKYPKKFRGRKMAKMAWLIGAIACFLAILLLFI